MSKCSLLMLFLFCFCAYAASGQEAFALDLKNMTACGFEEVSIVIEDKVFIDKSCSDGICAVEQNEIGNLEVYKIFRSKAGVKKTNAILFLVSIKNIQNKTNWMYTPHPVDNIDLKVLSKQLIPGDVISILTTEEKYRFPNNTLRLNIGC